MGGGSPLKWSSENMPPTKEDKLFEENHWYVLKLYWTDEDSYGDNKLMDSGVGHDCQHFADEPDAVQILGGDDVLAGYCWWCKEEVPESIRTVWTLHNFDFIQQMNKEAIGYCKQDAEDVLKNRQWEVKWAKTHPPGEYDG
jgi:hypothetical protein